MVIIFIKNKLIKYRKLLIIYDAYLKKLYFHDEMSKVFTGVKYSALNSVAFFSPLQCFEESKRLFYFVSPMHVLGQH